MASVGGTLDGEHPWEPEEEAAFLAWMEKTWPLRHDLHNSFQVLKNQYPHDWWRKILKRLRLKNETARGPLVASILRRWAREGGPERGPEDEYDDDLKIIVTDATGTVPSPYAPRWGRKPDMTIEERTRRMTERRLAMEREQGGRK